MKIIFIGGTVFLFLLSILAEAKPVKAPPFHLDLEASSAMYQKALEQFERSSVSKKPTQSFFRNGTGKLSTKATDGDESVEAIIAIGKRNLDWLIYINKHREIPLTFTVPGGLTGIPITAPSKNSGRLVNERYQKLVAKLPPEMRAVLVEGKDFTQDPPIAVEEYLRLGNEMDKTYQVATRWKLMLPYLEYYKQNRQRDIRGYYFLKDWPELEKKLKNWADVSEEEKSSLRQWLVNLCYNSWASEPACKREVTQNEGNQTLWDLYQHLLPTSRLMFEEYFKIQNPRPDLTWDSNEMSVIPFKHPGIEGILEFLAVNIEDEWKWKGWQLKLDFRQEADVHIEFESGVTPHVNELGGNTIVMDSNSPLTEWDVQWTIRHEFGHVLGVPDCYVEFFDADEGVMVNYQIDIENLMCSRRGKMNDVIFEEMKRVYRK